MLKKLRFWLPALAAIPLLLVVTASAVSADSERITSFDSKATVAADGSVAVTETIDYDFGPNQRHGIYRYFPLETQDSSGNIYASDPRVQSVGQDGQPAQYTAYDQGNDYIIKIGDPNNTISGGHEYVITYTLPSFAIKGSQGDIVRFNVTGNGWTVPIDQVTSTIDAVPVAQRTTCYTGPAGSTAQNCQASVVHKPSVAMCKVGATCNPGYIEATFSASNLNPGDGLTDEVEYPPNSFTSYLTPGKSPREGAAGPSSSGDALTTGAIIGLAGSGLMFVAAILLWVGRRVREWQRKRSQVVIAEYEPPDGLRPAELGMMMDDTANMTEITATLIDLAIRGHLKITQVRPKTMFRKAEYQFDRLQGQDQLENYEQTLLGGLFTGGQTTVLLSKVDRVAMQSAVTAIKQQLSDRLTAKGYYSAKSKTPQAFQAAPVSGFKVKSHHIWSVVLLIVAIALAIIGGRLVIYTALFAYVIFLAALNADRLTSAGISEWAKVDGFKLFLKMTEADRLKFTDAPERTPQLFSQFLPAAIALGVEKEWAKQFAGMDVTSAVGYWYYGPYASYNSFWIANELGSSFSPAIATGFVPQQSTSGGFGGGFSGGGGGGGGGGSW